MSDVPLREHVQVQLDALEKRLSEQHDSDEKALQLKADEIDKQFNDLRIEIRRIADIQNLKLSRDEWKDYHDRQLAMDYVPRVEFAAYREQITSERAKALGEVKGQAKVTALVYSVIGMTIAVASVIVGYIWHR